MGVTGDPIFGFLDPDLSIHCTITTTTTTILLIDIDASIFYMI